MVRALSPPRTTSRRTVRLLPGLLDLEIPFPVEDCQVLYLNATATTPGSDLAVAVRRTDLDACLRTLKALDCDPEFLVPEPLLLWHGGRPVPETASPANPYVLHVTSGHRINILIADAEHRLRRFATGTPSDAGLYDRTLHGIGLEPGNVQRTAVRDDNGDPKPDGIPAAASPPPGGNAPPPDRELRLAAVMIRGVAVACRGETMNLRQGDYAHPKRHRQRQRAPRNLALALTVSAGILLAGHGIALRQAEQQAHIQTEAFHRMAAELAGYRITRPGDEAVAAVRAAMRERIPTGLRAWMLPAVPGILSGWLAAAQASDIRLHGLHYDNGQWRLTATARTPAAAREFAARARDIVPGIRIHGVDEGPADAPRHLILATPAES